MLSGILELVSQVPSNKETAFRTAKKLLQRPFLCSCYYVVAILFPCSFDSNEYCFLPCCLPKLKKFDEAECTI